MRYLSLMTALGVLGLMSGCTTSYFGNGVGFEPGYDYTGYGPAFLEEGGGYGAGFGRFDRFDRFDRDRFARDHDRGHIDQDHQGGVSMGHGGRGGGR